MKLSPKDMFMHAQRNAADIKRKIIPQLQSVQYVTRWHTYLTTDAFLYTLTTQAWDENSRTFWVIKAFRQISPQTMAPPSTTPTFTFCAVPLEARGQNKTSKELQNSPDTNSFPHVTWRGLAGWLDWSDSGMSQPPTLRYLITSSGDGMPFLTERLRTVWHRLKRSQMGRRIYKSLSVGHAGLRWDEEMGAHLRGCY